MFHPADHLVNRYRAFFSPCVLSRHQLDKCMRSTDRIFHSLRVCPHFQSPFLPIMTSNHHHQDGEQMHNCFCLSSHKTILSLVGALRSVDQCRFPFSTWSLAYSISRCQAIGRNFPSYTNFTLLSLYDWCSRLSAPEDRSTEPLSLGDSGMLRFLFLWSLTDDRIHRSQGYWRTFWSMCSCFRCSILCVLSLSSFN